MGCISKRVGSEKSGLVLGLAVVVAAMLLTACAAGERGEQPTATPTREPGYSTRQTFNQSLTIDGVTVVMDSITHSANHFAVEYSYSSGAPGVDPTQMIKGISLTRADGNLYYSDSPSPIGSEVFPLYSRIPGGEGELVDVSLGTYMIPANVSGSVSIDLGTAHKKGYRASSRRASRGPITAPLNAEFSIGDRKYRVTKLVVFPADFRLWIEPVNEAARRTVLTAESTLTDNTGGTYRHVGGSTSFDDLLPRGHEWRQFRFIGIIPESKTSLTLGIQGGETVVGPFVFEDVRVASDDAPAGATPGAGGAVDLGRGGVRWVAYPKE